MKKMFLVTLMLLLSLALVGCGSEEQLEIDLSTPEGVTKEYIRLVNNYEYSKATGLFTQQYEASFVTLAESINEIKNYNKLDQSYIDKKPDVINTKDNQSKIWYQYEDGQYVYFQLNTENGSWKINKVSFWTKKDNGDPK